ncbi:hypothetical protein CUJ83_02210 [Methanocella sp. CWC-04]|uniref:Uncharacterized protein n=1 Tax=Methanooceanicella nereidis TaxID=2052831 RepID=A0AAP2RC09_9EURY|nr:hypothetical protein [Methanocella sp. CWC-04]MCD1293810.1 hypothetical protein [Methanocella sp. CWC-04]
MNGKKARKLSESNSISDIILNNAIVITFVVIVLILSAGVFVLYDKTGQQDATLRKKQADYDNLNTTYGELAKRYASLDINHSDLTVKYDSLRSDYENISGLYDSLQNRTTDIDNKVNVFLEDSAVISYTYKVTMNTSENSTMKTLSVTAYNVGKTDAGNVTIICTVEENETTSMYNRTFTNVGPMEKRQAEWVFDNSTNIIDVWAGLDWTS